MHLQIMLMYTNNIDFNCLFVKKLITSSYSYSTYIHLSVIVVTMCSSIHTSTMFVSYKTDVSNALAHFHRCSAKAETCQDIFF